MPVVRCPAVPGWQWEKVIERKSILESILGTAKKVKADLIVMSTDGRNGFLDALRGSQTEQVLGQARCPVLAVPARGWIPSLLEKESQELAEV
jgi:nucleotide-binding universal stress UspA family protein